MNRLSKCLFVASASLAMTGVAFADDPPAGDAPAAGATVDANASVGTDGATPAAGATMTAGAAFSAETWPLAYVERPQNIYTGGIELSPRLNINYVKTTDAMGNSDSSTVSALNIGGRYGVTDKVEVLAAFDRIILTGVDGIEAGDRVKGNLTVGAGFVVAKGALDVEVKAAINYDLGGFGVGEAIVVLAGADVRYHLSPKMWLGTPVNRPGLVLGLTNFKLAGTEIPDSKPLLINIPVAFAFQATPEFAIQANTNLLQFRLNDASKGGPDGDAVTFIGTDEGGGIPFDLDFIYALSHKMDVQAKLDLDDLKNLGDLFAITAGINIRL